MASEIDIINDIIKKATSDDKHFTHIFDENTKCAPGRKHEAGSCASLAVLVELAKAYNKIANKNDMIKLSKNMESLNPQKYKIYLVYEINKRIGDKCTTQKCWGQQEFITLMEEKAREEFIKYTFRPDSPQGKFDWLSTFDINDVMEQYYTEDKGCKFFGAVPMDFADLDLEIAKVDYDYYYNKGIRKFGIVFNLDNHDQPGSHWTAMYTDLDKGHIFYFDSFGVKPEPRVRALMRQQARFLSDKKGMNIDNIRVDYNKVQHQFKNSECGVYSINFLIRMARGDNFDKLCNKQISDEKINKCRKIYFDRQTKKR